MPLCGLSVHVPQVLGAVLPPGTQLAVLSIASAKGSGAGTVVAASSLDGMNVSRSSTVKTR